MSEITLPWRNIAYLLWKVSYLSNQIKIYYSIIITHFFCQFYISVSRAHTQRDIDTKPNIMGYELPVIMLLIKSLHAHSGKKEIVKSTKERGKINLQHVFRTNWPYIPNKSKFNHYLFCFFSTKRGGEQKNCNRRNIMYVFGKNCFIAIF